MAHKKAKQSGKKVVKAARKKKSKDAFVKEFEKKDPKAY